jgi:UDP-N-acetylglucosamine diphosphorylase/glucosamine-1-phosphate N-acetyltransferase
MNYILFDDLCWDQLLPLTFTRPVSELRIGILKIREKWEKSLQADCSTFTRDYLRKKFPVLIGQDNILINSSLLPDQDLPDRIRDLNQNTALISGNKLLAVRLDEGQAKRFHYSDTHSFQTSFYSGGMRCIDRPWKIFLLNGDEICNDFNLVTRGRQSVKLSSGNNLLSPEFIFAEEGVRSEFVTINASTGPVYLGRNSEIMEGTVIRGPFVLCENSKIKLSAKIYGPTTIGPGSTLGGEIKNSVIQGYTNKSHDGYLGNSVLGEWCNLGADTNTSNKKNNFSEIKMWSYPDNKYINTGLYYCGLIMADHSKCGINTMFNTGTVVGVNSNIFGAGYTANFIPSFTWGGPSGYTVYSLDKAYRLAEKMMSRNNIQFTDMDRDILSYVFKFTEKYRIK